MLALKVDMRGDISRLKSMGAWPLQIRKAMTAAQKAALQAMKREAVADTTEDYYIKATAVRKAITIANYAKGGRFIVRGARQPLHHYKLSPTKRRKKPVMLFGAVKRAGGLKPLGSAFLIPTKTGKHIAMKRKGSSRLPIEPLIGPAIPQIVRGYWESDIAVVGRETLRQVFWEKVQSFINTGRYKSSDLSRYSSSYNPMEASL